MYVCMEKFYVLFLYIHMYLEKFYVLCFLYIYVFGEVLCSLATVLWGTYIKWAVSSVSGYMTFLVLLHDWFGFVADTHKILISLDFLLSKLLNKCISDNIIALFSDELKVFSKHLLINPYNLSMMLTGRYIYFKVEIKFFYGYMSCPELYRLLLGKKEEN